MKKEYIESYVKENGEIKEGIYKLKIKNLSCDKRIVPGQFYMLRCWNGDIILSRPISVYDKDGDRISFLYQVIGKGTEKLSKLNAGDRIQVLGPLGNGFDLSSVKGRVAVVTGGIGIAPMNLLVKSARNADITLFSGFRSEPYAAEGMRAYVNKINIATESGEYGHKGFITDIFKPENFDMVLCCGPEIMMSKVIKMCNTVHVPVLVSMERHMACGIGACLVCTCSTKYGNLCVCKDGPVFSGNELII